MAASPRTSWEQRHRQRRVAEGRCQRCGRRNPNPAHPTCPRCRHEARVRRKRLYARRARQGVCPQCGKPSDGEFIVCPACREAHRASARCVTRAAHARHERSLRERRREEGACPYCGRDRDDPGRRMCRRCRERKRDAYRRDPLRVKLRRAGRPSPARPPRPVCPSCGLQKLRCRLCGRFISPVHGEGGCDWTCRCGWGLAVGTLMTVPLARPAPEALAVG